MANKKEKVKAASGQDFIHLTTKDQLTKKCADYLPKLISIYIKSLLNNG